EGDGRAAGRAGLPLQGRQEGDMPPVYAVEVADGHRPGPALRRRRLVPGDRVDGHVAASRGSGPVVVILPSGNETARPLDAADASGREPFPLPRSSIMR